MALTIRKDPESANLGPLKIRSYEVDFDNSYATGGLAFDISADFDVIKGAVIETRAGYHFEVTSKDAPASAKVKVYAQSAQDLSTKIKAVKRAGSAAGAHAVPGLAAADKLVGVFDFDALKDLTSNRQAFGTLANLASEFSITGVSVANNTGGTAASANDGVIYLFTKAIAAAALAEVAATTDLSTVTKVGILVWGRKS